MGQTGDEQEWIRLSREGRHEAFEALVTRYQAMIHSLTYRMTGSMSDSEDLAQETFIQAYRQLAGFRGEASFSSWLYRIGINLCLNWRKRNERRQQLHEELAQEEPAVRRMEEELSDAIQQALLELDPKQRAAIVLTVYEGLNHAEAARALGCTEATVSWRVFVARQKLKRLLEPKLRQTR
ncbi:MAG: RNA polymerase sigma factor [Verrucomicrobiota bacterium]